MELPNRLELEQRWERQIGRTARRHRRLIRDHWGSPPDPRNVPLEVWDRIAREQRDETAAALLLLFMASASSHVQSGLGTAPDPALTALLAQRGAAWARPRAAEVGQGWAETGREMLLRTAAEQDRALAEPGGKPLPGGTWLVRLQQAFGPDRAAALAITGTTEAQTAGGDAGMLAAGLLSAADLWITEKDERVCPVCNPLHNTQRRVWARFQPNGPPAHPRCRCHILYAREQRRRR